MVDACDVREGGQGLLSTLTRRLRIRAALALVALYAACILGPHAAMALSALPAHCLTDTSLTAHVHTGNAPALPTPETPVIITTATITQRRRKTHRRPTTMRMRARRTSTTARAIPRPIAAACSVFLQWAASRKRSQPLRPWFP